MSIADPVHKSEPVGPHRGGGLAGREPPPIDPELIDEAMPFAVGAATFLAALSALACCRWLDIATEADVPATIGVAVLVAVLAPTLMRGSEVGRPVGRNPRFRLGGTMLTVAASASIMAVVLWLLGLLARFGTPFLLLWAALSLGLAMAALAAAGIYRRLLAAEGRLVQRIALVGSLEQTAGIARALQDSDRNIVVTGIYDEVAPSGGGPAAQPLAGIHDLVERARAGRCDRVILAVPFGEHERINRILARLDTVPVTVQICFDAARSPAKIQGASRLGSLVFLDLQRHPMGPRGMIVKAMMDYSLAFLALVLLSPLMALIALAIKLDSRGPVFFVQARGGYCGRAINVIKFRSMTVLENGENVPQAVRNDPRVTRVGGLLRRTSLDELPQLFNVLRGELSLVGPRPHALSHDKYYGEIIDQYFHRYKIKPGVTGWAQINGLRSETRDPEQMRERVRYDLHYIDNWSPWLDVKILMRTVIVLLFDHHAY